MKFIIFAAISAVLLLSACNNKAAAPTDKAPETKPETVDDEPAVEAAKGEEVPEPAAPEAPPSDVPDKVEGANLTLGTIEADGLKAENLSCKLEGGGGLLAGPLTIGALATRSEFAAAGSALSRAARPSRVID